MSHSSSKGTAALLIASMPKKVAKKPADEDMDEDMDEGSDAYEAVAEEMMAAFESKDSKALAAALRDLKDC